MPVRINGASSGYVELAAPAVAGTTSLTLPATSGTVPVLASGASSGESSSLNVSTKPWNMPWGILGTSFSTSSAATSAPHTSYATDNISASVTYGANRKLRVSLLLRPFPNGGVQPMQFKVLRGSTEVFTFLCGSPGLSASEAPMYSYFHVFTTPSTAATETFSVQFRAVSVSALCYSWAAAGDGGKQLVIEDIGPA